MADKDETALQHIAGRAVLSVNSRGSGMVSRGKRDAAKASANPHYLEAVAAYQVGDFTSAAVAFRLAAEQGHAESQYCLSLMCDAGQGLPQDKDQSTQWERRAAEQGHAYAQANVSFRYYAAGNFAEAFAWCRQAAYSRLPWAQYYVGLMHRKGEGVEQSNAEAAHWYRLAAAQNFAEAQQKLADLYYTGQGVALDYTQAAAWYRRAADGGNAEAQFQLGHLYAIGQGIEHDYTQSRYWIRKAAEQGHEQASVELKRREYRDP